MVGLDGLEPSTSRLSGVRSNHLSYKPNIYWKFAEANFVLHLIQKVYNFLGFITGLTIITE